MFCSFSLRSRLRATTACNFSSLISPDVSAPAALASLLFNPPEPQNHEKTQCFATFLPFRAPASSFFWSFLFWLFSLLTAFSSLHIVGSLTSKLPSNMFEATTNNHFRTASKGHPLQYKCWARQRFPLLHSEYPSSNLHTQQKSPGPKHKNTESCKYSNEHLFLESEMEIWWKIQH